MKVVYIANEQALVDLLVLLEILAVSSEQTLKC